MRRHAVSILPLHLLGGFYATGSERVLSPSVSADARVSYFRRSGTAETDPFISEQYRSDDFH